MNWNPSKPYNDLPLLPPEQNLETKSILKACISARAALAELNQSVKLTRLAVAHYQFEAIHPFTDGNGRTGRVVNSLYLIQEELLTLPILYLSLYIIQNKQDYYQLLLKVTREQAWEEWFTFILKGIEETSQWTTEKIQAITQLAEHTREFIKESLPKIYSYELVDLIFEQPYCRINNLVERGIAKRQTASVYLKQLCEIGVLVEVEMGREKLFIHPSLLDLLTAENNQIEKYTFK